MIIHKDIILENHKNWIVLKFLFPFLLLLNNLFANDLKPVTLQLKWQHQFQFAGFYMAKEKGFYKNVGLDVNLIEPTSVGFNTAKDVLQGKSDFGISNSRVILNYLEGAPLVALMTSFQKSPLALMSLSSSKITTPKDLMNKRISLSSHSIDNIALQAMLLSQKVSFDDFTQLPFDKNNLQKLIHKHIDAFSVYTSSEPFLLKEKNIGYHLIYPDDYGFDFYSDILFTTQRYIKQNPKTVQDFYNASIKGWLYAFTHLQETVNIIHKKYNTMNKSKEALLFEAKSLKKISGIKRNFGEIQKSKIQNIINIIGLIHPQKYPQRSLTDFFYHQEELVFSNKELAFLNKKRVLKVHNELNWPPYNFNENGKAKGFSVDYMKLIAKKLNMQLDFVSGPTWNDFLTMIQKDELDVIINIKKTPKRSEFLNFTDKYYTAFNAIFTKKGTNDIKLLNDLSGKTVALVKGFYTQELLEKYYPSIKLHLTNNSVEAMKAVLSDKAHALIGQKGVIEYLAVEHTLNNLQLSSFIEDKRLQSELRLATHKNNILLNTILQKAQNAISEQEFLHLKQKWFKLKELSKSIQFSRNQKNYLLHKEEIKLCSNIGNFPLDDLSNHRHVGVMKEIFDEIKTQIPIPLQLIPLASKKDFLNKIKRKECDIIASVTSNEHLFEQYQSSKQLFSNELVLITKLNKAFITNIHHLLDKTFITTSQGYFNALKKHFPTIRLEYIKNTDIAFKKIKKNEAYGLIDIRLGANYLIQKYGIGELKVAGKVCEKCSVKTSIGILKSEPTLYAIVQKVIENTSSDIIEDIISRWSLVQYEKNFDYKTLTKYIFSFLAVLLVFIFWMIKLKIEVNKRQEAENKLKELNDKLEHRVLEEIEKNRQQQFTMFQQSRLAQMGEMISMIAHQWRQPLNAISSASTSLEAKTMLNKLEKEFILNKCHKIAQYVHYLSTTIDDFKNFFRPEKEKSSVTLNELIDSALGIIEDALIQNKITVEKIYTSEVILDVYANEFKQVVLNLLKNAQDVLREKKVAQPYIRIETYDEANHAVLCIQDNGGGIEGKNIPHIFDPYFSTKSEKSGTGLGLYMCKTIIEEHCNGEIIVHNTSEGASFTIKLYVK